MAENDSDLERIKELLQVMRENDLVEIEIKHGEDKICIKRAQPQQPAVIPVPTIATPAVIAGGQQVGLAGQSVPSDQQPLEKLIEIKSPIVGTFYQAPSPDSEPYIQVGLHVEPQTLVCIIEAMKVMNEIKAEISGTIAEVCVANGQAVEYGQVLFRVRPD